MQPWASHWRLDEANPVFMKKIFMSIFCLVSWVGFSQKQELNPFTAIDVFGPFQIELIKSDQEAVEMQAINVDKDDLTVEVHRGQLVLKLRSRHFLTDWDSDKFRKEPRIKTKIYYKDLDELKISAGGSIESAEAIKSKKLVIEGSMGAEIDLSTAAETMYVRTSMGATVNLRGQTDFLEVKANMGGVLNANRLESKSAYVKANMGADVSIFASEEVDIDAAMGASVRYSGEPTVRHTNTKIGADVRKRDR
jgi:hypothetical protein